MLKFVLGTERSWSTCSSPNYYDHEETTPTQGKKSVISKVKEKAKKLKYSLSGKKKLHENDVHDDNTTPLWGVNLDDDDEKDEDPEYLGAPSNIFLTWLFLLFSSYVIRYCVYVFAFLV